MTNTLAQLMLTAVLLNETNWFVTNSCNLSNSPAPLTITQKPVTNWTSFTLNQTNELGYIATQHIAKVRYDGAEYIWTLKEVPSKTAVWRKLMVLSGDARGITNYYGFNWTNIWTNISPNCITNKPYVEN